LLYRIHRSTTRDAIVFALSGDLDCEHTAQLQELLARESPTRVLLDLKDVTRADRAAVRFLATAEAAGIRIVNCPLYVRSWMAVEHDDM